MAEELLNINNNELVELTPEELSKLKRVELNEEESEHLASEPYSYWKSVFRVFLKKPSAIIGLSVGLLILLGAIFIPMLAPKSAFTMDAELINIPPNGQYWFGTDLQGRNLFFICWKGLGKSMILALICSAINIVLGTLVGLAWGFFRKIDRILIEIYNLISNIPSLLLYMLMAVVFSSIFKGVEPEVRLCFALCIFGWLGVALFVRNFTLIITNREYNIASKTLGSSPWRIMLKNLLPFLLGVIITELSLMIPGMVSSEVSLSYFGFGLPSNAISIGAVLELGRQEFNNYPWQLIYPGLMLAIVIFVFYLLGLALSDSLDPKKHR